MLASCKGYSERVMQKRFAPSLLGIIMGFGLLITACSQAPTKVKMNVTVSTQTNPDSMNRPLSVVTKLYQLRDKSGFEQLSLPELSGGSFEDEMLAKDLVSKQELVFIPGQDKWFDLDISPATQYIGVLAMYRKPDLNRWKLLFKVRDLADDPRLMIDRCGLVSNSSALDPIIGQDLSLPMSCPAATNAPAVPKPSATKKTGVAP